MNAEPNLEMDQLPFGEYAQRVLADTGARIKFSHLVRSDLTYADIEVKYGEETAINVGIARDPDAHESTDEDFAKARPAIQVDPELVQAYNRGDLRIRPDLVNGPGDALRDHLAAKGIKARPTLPDHPEPPSTAAETPDPVEPAAEEPDLEPPALAACPRNTVGELLGV